MFRKWRLREVADAGSRAECETGVRVPLASLPAYRARQSSQAGVLSPANPRRRRSRSSSSPVPRQAAQMGSADIATHSLEQLLNGHIASLELPFSDDDLRTLALLVGPATLLDALDLVDRDQGAREVCTTTVLDIS